MRKAVARVMSGPLRHQSIAASLAAQ
jgi:hypothetical protein